MAEGGNFEKRFGNNSAAGRWGENNGLLVAEGGNVEKRFGNNSAAGWGWGENKGLLVAEGGNVEKRFEITAGLNNSAAT